MFYRRTDAARSPKKKQCRSWRPGDLPRRLRAGVVWAWEGGLGCFAQRPSAKPYV